MPSLIPGYEYDIFISYRQKDNKGDRWVSEFVESLKTELESTFKEEISIYFDVNPHDGLLETHDVDASLKEKLKCLVFIPVLSRTYCDPKSFAWKNEFEAFVEQASRDQLGIKVKLPNGNIASRVLPVRIHDLDINDIKLCESLTGETLRDIEFIYATEGVNRPLRSSEDKPNENLNKTIYRDQVNKTALAIKEIILGLKGEPDILVAKNPDQREQERDFYDVKKPAKSTRQKLLTGAGILAILIIAALFVWPGLIRRKDLERLISEDGKIPVAVMPFQNMTSDTTWDVWQKSIQSNMITFLSNSEDLKVRQLETVTGILESKGLTDYASLTPSVESLITKKLGASIFITGSIKQSGSTLRLNTQLIDSKTEEVFKSFQIDCTEDGILIAIDSLSVEVQNYIITSILSKSLSRSKYWVPSSSRSTEAYKYYLIGEKAWYTGDVKTQIEMYTRAIKADSDLYLAYASLSYLYLNYQRYDRAKYWCRKYHSKLDLMNRGDKMYATQYYQRFFDKDNYDPARIWIQSMEIDDHNPEPHFKLAIIYSDRQQYDKAIPESKKALKIFKKEWGVEPWTSRVYTDLAIAYYNTGQIRKAKKILREAEQDYPATADKFVNLSDAYYRLRMFKNAEKIFRKAGIEFSDNKILTFNHIIVCLLEGDTVAANAQIDKYRSICLARSEPESSIVDDIGIIHSDAGLPDKAEEYERKALAISTEREMPYRLWSLANFLINNDRKITEGIDLIDKALLLSPDNSTYLGTKGWGLYKQGKYKESLDVLQRAWDLAPVYDYTLKSHLETARNAVAGRK